MHNIDRDVSALELSQTLCERLGYGARMSFACEDVSLNDGKAKTEWGAFGVVFLAALVGMDTQSKLAILSSLAPKLQPGTLVVARSAQGLRSVLYPVRPNFMVVNQGSLIGADTRAHRGYRGHWV